MGLQMSMDSKSRTTVDLYDFKLREVFSLSQQMSMDLKSRTRLACNMIYWIYRVSFLHLQQNLRFQNVFSQFNNVCFFIDLRQKSAAHTVILQINRFCQDGWGHRSEMSSKYSQIGILPQNHLKGSFLLYIQERGSLVTPHCFTTPRWRSM